MLIIPPFYDGLSGIITYFNNSYRNHYLDYIKVYPSSTHLVVGRNGAEDLIKRDYESSSLHWCSETIKHSNVTFHFPKHFIKLQGYTLKSRSDSIDPYPTGWKLEGSNSNTTNAEWQMIQEIGPVDDINGDGLQKTYTVTSNEYYSYFRFIQTSNNHLIIQNFCFSKVEFFGDVIGSTEITCNLQKSYLRFLLSPLYFVFLVSK